ncbi:MAG: amino acid adenylation domain-containing protein [Marinilabiliaceae bacterium]|nr:amino acid adenylation domain-containing protein [Marinilabiliaceae bacterium]
MQIHIMEYLEATCSKYADKVAIVDRDRSMTFEELRGRSISMAKYIINLEVPVNTPVAVYLPKSVECVLCYSAILYSGRFYVPIDTKSPLERIEVVLGSLNPDLIITNQLLKKNLLAIGYPAELIIDIESIINKEASVEEACILPPHHIDADPAYALYTSGSTGKSKGVVVPHRAVIDYIDWAIDRFQIDASYVIGNQAPFQFDQSVFDIYLMMATGSTMVLIPEELFIFPAKLLTYLNEEKISLIFWVPSLLVTIASFQLLDQIELSYLKMALFGGEVLPSKPLNYWRKRLPETTFVNMYGPTEITVDCTYYIVEREIADDESVPIGYACRNSGVLILNDKDQLTEVGEQGELCVRGSSLALGYYNNPEKTNEVFVQNPLNKHFPEKIYRTGDIVYQNERGEIIFVCRKDFQIQHLGYRIELGDIEVAVMSVGLVENACVMYNDSKKEIALFFVANQEVKKNELRVQLVRKLPKYMIPTAYTQLTELPLNANGKIDRKSLKKLLVQ